MRSVILQSVRGNLKTLQAKNFKSNQLNRVPTLTLSRYQSTSNDSNNATKSSEPSKEEASQEKEYTFLERMVIALKLDQIPQAVMNRQCFPIFETCSEIYARDKQFYTETLNLPDNFQTWVSVCQLHIWIAMVRLRMEPDGTKVNQYLVNVFFHLLEDKIRQRGINSDRIIKNTVKDLISGFRGATIAYDEGMCKDDAVLAAALWRNMLTTVKGEEIDVGLGYLVRYVRSQLQYVQSIPSDKLKDGIIEFPRPEAKL